MGCGDEKLSKSLTQTFTAHCNAMICQRVTLPGDAEWPKVADAVIEADQPISPSYTPSSWYQFNSSGATNTVVRTGVGAYTALLPNLGAYTGHVQVTAYGTGSER